MMRWHAVWVRIAVTWLLATAMAVTGACVAGAAPNKVTKRFGSSSGGTVGGDSGYVGGVAVNQGSVDFYVVDSGGVVGGIERVQRFDTDGNFLSQFGTTGSGDGQFSFNGSGAGGTAGGVAIDQSDGSVYVADPGNNRVQKFQADGTFVLSFGTGGSGGGQFATPVAGGAGPTRDGGER